MISRILLSMTMAFLLASERAVPALVCRIDALKREARARHEVLLKKIAASAQRTTESDDGFVIEIDSSRMNLQEIAEWISMERRCCDFLTFALEIPSGATAVRIRISGPEGTKAVLAPSMSRLVK
jgi:hypothetical protein